jgi:hypothetical protein
LEQSGSRIFVNVPEEKRIAVFNRDKPAVVTTWPGEEFQANFRMALARVENRSIHGLLHRNYQAEVRPPSQFVIRHS